MPCRSPILAWRGHISSDKFNEKTGKMGLVFRRDQASPSAQEYQLPCGKCRVCRLERARQWAVRCIHENAEHGKSCFLTLTYDDHHLPADGSLRPADMQLFLKRLRKRIDPIKIRFFQCGEYGEINQRPHHHCLLFGYDFPDKIPYGRKTKHQIYGSKLLNELWGQGFASIGNLTFDSACYTARYIMKKQFGRNAEEHYNGRKPEYITMSRRPGIGQTFFENYKEDIYNHDRCVVSSKLILKPPLYYDRLYERSHSERLQQLKADRKSFAQRSNGVDPDRYARKEKVLEVREKQQPRELNEILNQQF